MSLTSKQRAALRGAANTMDPVYQIGKGEIDETLKQGIADCIAARELIKVKVLENSEYDPREAADILCEALDCDCVQVIGRKFVLFKQKKKESLLLLFFLTILKILIIWERSSVLPILPVPMV